MRAGTADALGDVAEVERDDEADGDADQQQGETRVQLGHVAQGDREPLGHLLARAVAGVWSGATRRGAGGDDDGEQREEAVVEADERARHEEVSRTGRVVAGGTVHEHHRVDEQQDRRVEVEHDDIRVELRVDDDAADDGLGQDAGDQPAAQPDEVAAPGRAEDRAQERGGDGDHDEDGDQAVAELDEAVELERRGQVARRALGPVAAAQARPGQPDGAAGEHDQRREEQGQLVESVAQRG